MPGGWLLQVTQEHDYFTESISASICIPTREILFRLFTSYTSSEHSIHGLTGTMQDPEARFCRPSASSADLST